MRVHQRLRLPLLILAALLLLKLAMAGPGPAAKLPKEPRLLAAAANTFKTTFARGEAVPLAVAIANSAEKPLYVPEAYPPGVRLFDAEGKRVKGDPIPMPPPPPPSHFMKRKGKRVYVRPVWKLEPRSGRVIVVLDALKRYHSHIKKGQYTIRARVCSGIYDPSSVFRREDMRQKLWVEGLPTRPTGPRELTANETTIIIE